MSINKDIVITVYGHDRVIDKIAVGVFDINDADAYCDTINKFDLKENTWVFAKTISENIPYSLNSFLPMKFDVLVEQLDERALQLVLREFNFQELVRVLKDEKESVKEKIFRNMSKRAEKMLREDMECAGPVLETLVKESQEKFVNVVRYLAETGEISLYRSKDHSGDVLT